MPCSRHPDVVEGLVPCDRCQQPFCSNCVVELLDLVCCGECKTEQLRDMQSSADSLHLPLASVERRLSAWLLDSTLISVPLWAILLLFAPALRLDSRWGALGAGALGLWLSVGYEALLLPRNGQTPGKRALGIRVVAASGAPLSTGQAWGRALTRALLAVLWIVDGIPALFTAERVSLHDRAAGTRVVSWSQ